jgi:uncharacterized DUF497 family protein
VIEELRWDPWNIAHIARHHVEYLEVEEMVQNRPLFIRIKAGRLHVIGQSDAGRYLSCFADPLGYGEYYVVSARDATRAERRRYQSWRGK